MRKIPNSLRIFLILIGIIALVVLIFVCGSVIITLGIISYDVVDDYLTWRDYTIPLSQEIVDDLCTKFELESDDERCDHVGDAVYGPDFFDELYKRINPQMNDWTTFEEVDGKLGIYEFKREPIIEQADGLTYFVCHYDFTGDRVYPFLVFYYADGTIMRLVADVFD